MGRVHRPLPGVGGGAARRVRTASEPARAGEPGRVLEVDARGTLGANNRLRRRSRVPDRPRCAGRDRQGPRIAGGGDRPVRRSRVAGPRSGGGTLQAGGRTPPAHQEAGRRDADAVPLRHRPAAVQHRLQRRRPEARLLVLRSVRQRGAAGKFRLDRARRRPAGPLAGDGQAVRLDREPPGAVELGRHDVRVPHAAVGAAPVSPFPAGDGLPRGGRRTDGVRAPAGRAVGDLGVGLQRPGREQDVPVPGLRRAGDRAEAGARGRPGRGPVRHAAGAAGGAGGGGAQPETAREARAPRRLRILRGNRLRPAAPPGGGGTG